MSKLYKLRYLHDTDDIPKIRNNKLIIHMDGFSLDGASLFTEKRFVPPMINPKLFDKFSNILFVRNIKLTDKMFPPDMELNDKRKLFLVPSRFEKFFEQVRRTGSFQVLSENEIKENNTIEENAAYLLNLFLPKNSTFYYNANVYRIYNYEWNKKYFITKTQQRERIQTVDLVGRPKEYIVKQKTHSRDNYNVNITINLKKGSSKVSAVDSVKLSCYQRRAQIWDKWDTLMNIGYDNKIKAAKEELKQVSEEPTSGNEEEKSDNNERRLALVKKVKSIQNEKNQYNEHTEKRKVKQKRKSPKPSLLTSRTYYTSPSSLDQFNKINRDKKDSDLPVAYPIVEPYLAKDNKGGGATMKYTKRRKRNRKNKTMKRRSPVYI